jgi:hypothetical protein
MKATRCMIYLCRDLAVVLKNEKYYNVFAVTRVLIASSTFSTKRGLLWQGPVLLSLYIVVVAVKNV